MDALLRHVREGPDGVPEYHDTEVHADELTIGSAADRSIQLLGQGVAPDHAVIRSSGGGRASITCRRGRTVRVNDTDVVSAPLEMGGSVDIAGNKLRLVDPPAGFDVAIAIEPNANVAASAFEGAFRTDLSETWLSKRATAWVLTLATLVLGLLIPLGTIYLQRAGHDTPPGVPDDTWWTAGPLAPAHENAAGKRCSACHEKLFIHVQDTACRECHKSTADHVRATHLALTSLGKPLRCAQCHREHDDNMANFIVRDDALCTDCHAESDKQFPKLNLDVVTGFSLKTHPEFAVQLFEPVFDSGGTVLTEWRPQRKPLPNAVEQTNLKFSHQQHLDPDRVRRLNDNGALGCVDCHTPAADGEHFLPATMERTCKGCHELTFDPGARERQLPHGKPRDAMLLVQDYFARKLLDPNAGAATVERRRLPDTREEEEACTAPALTCGLRRARAEIDNQFTRRGCVSCHVVLDTGAEEVLDRYHVRPIRFSADYFTNVRFSHKDHAVQKDQSGDDACLSCHGARTTEAGAPVMIPPLAKCLECHSERPQTDRVTLQCISCHAYHPVPIIETAHVQK
jgi:predicted CXXCH cytochrome family protein